MLVMEQLGVLYRGDVGDVARDSDRDGDRLRFVRDTGVGLGRGDEMEEAVHGALQGKIAPGAGLEMHVVRRGGTGDRTVIVHDIAVQGFGEVEHVHVAVPDGLGHMGLRADDQVVRENREKIGQDVVFPALPALETDGMLAVGPVTEETGAAAEGLLVDFRRGGRDPARVELEGHVQPADGHLAGLRRLQGAEIPGGLRPHGKLVVDELVDIHGHNPVKLRQNPDFRKRPLQQGGEPVTDAPEFVREVGRQDVLPDGGVDFFRGPPAAVRHLGRIGIEDGMADGGEDADELVVPRSLPAVGFQENGVERGQAQFLARFAVERLQDGLAVGDMAADGRVPVTGQEVFRVRAFLEVDAAFAVDQMEMDDRMEELGTAVAIGARRLSDDQAAGLYDREKFLCLNGLYSWIQKSGPRQARCGIGRIQEVEHIRTRTWR